MGTGASQNLREIQNKRASHALTSNPKPMSESLPAQNTERLRELARRVHAQLPGGLFYALVVWCPGQPAEAALFSNAHRAESVVALESILKAHGLRP